MHLYTQIYEFSASIGALEGYVYNKKNIDEIDMKALDVWTGNQIDAYEMIPRMCWKKYRILLISH